MPDRPDVAIMLFDLSVTGVARNAVRIANASHASGLNTEIWLAQDGGELREAVDPGIALRALGAGLAPGYSRRDRKLASIEQAAALAAFYRDYRPAVALSSGNHFHDLAAAARRELKGPVDMHLLGRVSNALPNQTRSANPFKLLAKRRRAAKRYAAMDQLIAVSREIGDELVRKLNVPAAKVTLIRNGVDIASIRARSEEASPRWPWQDQSPVVLGVGRLAKQKNFELLIDAFALARRRGPAHLAIIGGGPVGAREDLMKRAEALGIADDVWLPGHVANPFPYYRAAQLFVLPSRWEGMSNVLLEAMACGCPVVAVRTAAGSAEILEGGRYGPLVGSDPGELADAILDILAKGHSPEVLVARAREFDLEASLKCYVELFELEIAKARGAASSPIPNPAA